jgi:hypothetical protein
VTDFNASAFENDPCGVEFLRSVLGAPRRAPAGAAGMRAAEAAMEVRTAARRRTRARREIRPSV